MLYTWSVNYELRNNELSFSFRSDILFERFTFFCSLLHSFIQSNVIFDDANRPLSQTFPIKLDILLTDYAVIWMQVQISILGSHS